MNRLATKIRLTLAALLVAALLTLTPGQASAQYYPSVVVQPAPVHVAPVTTFYAPPAVAPVTTFYAPAPTVVVPTHTYSFYAAPTVTYFAPPAVAASPAVTTTTFYRGGLLFPRRARAISTTTYYTPGFFRY